MSKPTSRSTLRLNWCTLRLRNLAVDAEGGRRQAQAELLRVGARHDEGRRRDHRGAVAERRVLVGQRRRRRQPGVADRGVAGDGDGVLVDEGERVGAAHRRPAVLRADPRRSRWSARSCSCRPCTSPPLTKSTVPAGSSSASRVDWPLACVGRSSRLVSSRSGLKYSHLRPPRMVRPGFTRQLSWM